MGVNTQFCPDYNIYSFYYYYFYLFIIIIIFFLILFYFDFIMCFYIIFFYLFYFIFSFFFLLLLFLFLCFQFSSYLFFILFYYYFTLLLLEFSIIRLCLSLSFIWLLCALHYCCLNSLSLEQNLSPSFLHHFHALTHHSFSAFTSSPIPSPPFLTLKLIWITIIITILYIFTSIAPLINTTTLHPHLLPRSLIYNPRIAAISVLSFLHSTHPWQPVPYGHQRASSPSPARSTCTNTHKHQIPNTLIFPQSAASNHST